MTQMTAARARFPIITEPNIALLKGRFTIRHGKTSLIERYHSAPLKISKTFRLGEEDGQLAVYLMDCSPGMLNGDHYQIELKLESGCHVYVTNQTFTKAHPTPTLPSKLTQSFTLGKDSLLEFFPEPLIPFAGSRFSSHTSFHLETGATLLFSDIITPGRTHRGERFQYDSLTNRMEVYRQGHLIAWDHFHMKPSLHRYQGIGAFEHYTHLGSLWIFSEKTDDDLLRYIREVISAQDDVLAGASLSHEQGGIAVRMLGHNTWRLQEIIKAVWDVCRPYLLQKPPFLERK